MKETEYIGNAFEELETVKQKLAEIVKSKGYQDLVQWEAPCDSASLLSTGINEKLTDNLIHSLNVTICRARFFS